MKIKYVDSRVNVNIFASTSVPFILTTVQVPNLALTHKKWITVYALQTWWSKVYLTLHMAIGLFYAPETWWS